MPDTNGHARPTRSDVLRSQLREAVLTELNSQGLGDPRVLAARLGAPVAATSEFFRRRYWPLETYLDVIDELDLPIVVTSKSVVTDGT